MYWEQVVKIYAEVNGVSTDEVKKDVIDGWTTKEMLFEAWLENEGIFGYTRKILNVIEAIEDNTL